MNLRLRDYHPCLDCIERYSGHDRPELVDNSAAGFVGFAIDTVNIRDWIV